jgi:hypothetical protein
MSRVDVEAWLDSQQIDHTRRMSLAGRPTAFTDAVIDSAIVRWLEPGEIQIEFFFNEQEELEWYRVSWYTFEL